MLPIASRSSRRDCSVGVKCDGWDGLGNAGVCKKEIEVAMKSHIKYKYTPDSQYEMYVRVYTMHNHQVDKLIIGTIQLL